MRTAARYNWAHLAPFILIIMLVNCQAQKQSRIVERKAVGVQLKGFNTDPSTGEQEKVLFLEPDIRAYINAPPARQFDADLPTNLIIFALPNGNSIEMTAGKTTGADEDWHFNIQHIAAQTRFLRKANPDYNSVVIYLEASTLSWPHWRRTNENSGAMIKSTLDSLMKMFEPYSPFITLSGHSGGGSFVNGFIEHGTEIPETVQRIAFLDSNYGYNESIGKKLSRWLQRSSENHLVVFAYNDSIALYEGKSFVSATGGTWYRSKMMIRDLSKTYSFERVDSTDLMNYRFEDDKALFILKKNPTRAIFHTEQVELNGFIHCLLFATPYENRAYSYFGNRAYGEYIQAEPPAILSRLRE